MCELGRTKALPIFTLLDVKRLFSACRTGQVLITMNLDASALMSESQNKQVHHDVPNSCEISRVKTYYTPLLQFCDQTLIIQRLCLNILPAVVALCFLASSYALFFPRGIS